MDESDCFEEQINLFYNLFVACFTNSESTIYFRNFCFVKVAAKCLTRRISWKICVDSQVRNSWKHVTNTLKNCGTWWTAFMICFCFPGMATNCEFCEKVVDSEQKRWQGYRKSGWDCSFQGEIYTARHSLYIRTVSSWPVHIYYRGSLDST